jgi:hypothetical protein
MAMARKISSNCAPLCFFALKVSLDGSGGSPRAIFFRAMGECFVFLTFAGFSENPATKSSRNHH